MPQKNSEGKFILSASEVATYVLCPKNWYLSYVRNLEPETKILEEQAEEQKKWLEDFDDARKYTWATRVIIFMIFFLVIFYFFTIMR